MVETHTAERHTEQDFEKACILHYNRISQIKASSFSDIPEALRIAYKLGHFGDYKTLLTPVIIEKHNNGMSYETIARVLKLGKKRVRIAVYKYKSIKLALNGDI